MAKRATGLVDKHIGHRIRARRLTLGVSQTGLGEALGLTFQQIQKYETGKNHIPIPTLLDAAKALQVPVAFFLDGITDTSKAPPSSDAIAELAADRRGFALAKAFLAIDSAAGRDAVLTVAEAFAKASNPVRKAA